MVIVYDKLIDFFKGCIIWAVINILLQGIFQCLNNLFGRRVYVVLVLDVNEAFFSSRRNSGSQLGETSWTPMQNTNRYLSFILVVALRGSHWAFSCIHVVLCVCSLLVVVSRCMNPVSTTLFAVAYLLSVHYRPSNHLRCISSVEYQWILWMYSLSTDHMRRKFCNLLQYWRSAIGFLLLSSQDLTLLCTCRR